MSHEMRFVAGESQPRALRPGRPGRRPAIRRAAVAVITMLYMLLLTTLTLALFYAASYNVQTSENFSSIAKAHAAAESGLRWMDYRFQRAIRPKTDKGTITTALADTLWPSLRDALATDLQNVKGADRKLLIISKKTDSIEAKNISIDASTGATFDVFVRHLGALDGSDSRFIRVSATGRYKNTSRTVSMDFKMDKAVKFAVVGKVPVQVGRDVIIDGPIGMGIPGKYPPLFTLSDFTHFDAALKTSVTNFQNYLKGSGVVNGQLIKNHEAYDGRICVNDKDEYTLATAAGYKDTNADGFIDEYDLFVARFDANKDGKISKAEFTNSATGLLYDANLFTLIDTIGLDATRSGYNDGFIDNRDGYAKVRGGIALATSAKDWNTNLAASGQTVNDQIKGPIATTDPSQPGVLFSATADDIFDLAPLNFEQCSLNFKAKTGAGAGAASVSTTGLPAGIQVIISNTVITPTYHTAPPAGVPAAAVNSGATVTEKTPYGSTTWQAQYARPRYSKVLFRNCQIAKGVNAVFDQCIFEGVTFVDMTRNITNSSGSVTTNKDDGMTWSKRMKVGTFSNTTALTSANSNGFTDGNNIRFNDCTFRGPLVGPYATAYSHFTNTWEFTGATLFDNLIDQTATIVAPQVNIEMGSFTTAGKPSTLVGVVVAGNIDIRGTTNIDGSIVVTGDGAGNTTLGYFGNNDAVTDPGAMPEGGYGAIQLRYNPFRAMPDGIMTNVDLAPQIFSYREGAVQ
jgi:Tfp pilus assembly protein PilX